MLEIRITGTQDNGPIRTQVEEAMAAIGFMPEAKTGIVVNKTADEAAEKLVADKRPSGRTRAAKAEAAQITENPENRVNPEEAAEREAQDQKDEAAEVKATVAKLTLDDVRAALGKYVKAYGMPAAQEDGPKLIGKIIPGKTKISDIPADDQEIIKKTIAGVEEMLAKNPFGREPNL